MSRYIIMHCLKPKRQSGWVMQNNEEMSTLQLLEYYQRPFLSHKNKEMGFCCALLFSWNCHAEKIMLIVPVRGTESSLRFWKDLCSNDLELI